MLIIHNVNPEIDVGSAGTEMPSGALLQRYPSSYLNFVLLNVSFPGICRLRIMYVLIIGSLSLCVVLHN